MQGRSGGASCQTNLCLGLLSAVFCLLASPVSSACHLALVLALDVSTSVDAREYALQRDGLAAALSSPTVRSALFAGNDRIAITVFEWSGRHQQSEVLSWTLLEDQAALIRAVTTIRTANRSFDKFQTGMGRALLYAQDLIQRGPECIRRTIDISGDGVTNDGMDPPTAYRWNDFDGITVNGLAIRTTDHRVPIYYLREVIRGPDAFVEIAEGYEDFENAMRRKLIREIGVVLLGEVGKF